MRHGESQWNLENRFTGWQDVDLTKKGIEEAAFAANQIIKEDITINTVYTSLLKRATHTTDIVTKKSILQKKTLNMIGDLMKGTMVPYKDLINPKLLLNMGRIRCIFGEEVMMYLHHC